jgi:hypothetical protein
LGQLAFVAGLGVAAQAQGAGPAGFPQHAAPVGFQDGRPQMLAAAEIGEIRAGTVHREAAGLVSHADRVAVSALHFAEKMRLVRLGNSHRVGVKKIQALKLKWSFKLKC